jgi:SAM-dependent methyltransferase
MKLHIGCGTIYLKGYVNVDAGPQYLADKAPKDVLEENTTTFDQYYKQGFCKGTGITVADIQADICERLPFEDCSVEEVVMRQVLEHIPHYNVDGVLGEIHRVMEYDGRLILSVPDTLGTARELIKAEAPEAEDWCIRLLYGTQKNQYSHHFCGYSHRTLMDLLSRKGFDFFCELDNINIYPAIHVLARKV